MTAERLKKALGCNAWWFKGADGHRRSHTAVVDEAEGLDVFDVMSIAAFFSTDAPLGDANQGLGLRVWGLGFRV